MNQDDLWKKRASKYLYQSKWFNLRHDQVELPSGSLIDYTFVDHPGYVMVVPLLDDGRVILERVYRYTVGQTVLECPSGGLDGEPPEIAAIRELREETGWHAEKLTPLGSFFGSNGISNEVFHLFLATGLQLVGNPLLEPTEQIELEFRNLSEVVELACSGEIKDGPSALALILANNLENSR